MKKILSAIVLTLATALVNATAYGVDADMDVEDFALVDQNGVFHQMSRYSDRDAVVLLVQSNGCAISRRAADVFERVAEQFEGMDIRFLLLNASRENSREAIRAEADNHAMDLPVLLDETQLVARSLGLTRSGQVAVIDPARMRLIYRGPLGESEAEGSDGSASRQVEEESRQRYLVAALEALSRGESLAIREDSLPRDGVPLNLPDLPDTVSYSESVVPILQERCVACHQQGGKAPWAMDSHRMVRGWSAMMKEAIMTMRMPPGQIDEPYLDEFIGVPHLSSEEKVTLVNWIEAGAPADIPEGEANDLSAASDPLADPLAVSAPTASEWTLGEPDLVIEFPTQEIPAGGMMDYAYVPVEIGLRQDRWVRAYEFDIGNRSAVHHLVVYTQDEKQQRQNSSRGGSRSNFGSYSPGREYVVFDENAGVLLEKDMRFMLQMNYRAMGEPGSDSSRLALYFHDSEPDHALVRTAVMNGDFEIPPGASHHEVVASSEIGKDSWLYSLAPHMHYRGKSMSYEAEYPDGTREKLLVIPNFQYNWQMLYRFREARHLPAGTRIIATGVFDNSAQNPLNPDPGQEVIWGDQVWDEMFIGWMELGSPH